MNPSEPEQPVTPVSATPDLMPARCDASLPTADRARAILGLARQDLPQAEALFKSIPLDEQQALVLSVPPDERLSLLLLPEDATALVQALPELELHRTVQTAGKWEAMEVVELASEAQINFMLDHDCWRGESLDSRKFTDWIQLFLECDDAQIFRLLTSINADLLALALKKHVHFEKDIMVQDTYFLDPDWVKGSNPAVQMFLDRLYAMDPNLWIRLLAWVRTHSKGTIEADAVEGRESRLKGKGFPAPTLAITVYYPVEFDAKGVIDSWRGAFLATAASSAIPMAADPARDVLFLQRVLHEFSAGHADDLQPGRWEKELVDVANKVMVADQVDIGDLRQQRETVDKVRRWISIGLEAAASGDVKTGVVLLQHQQLEFFFRVATMFFDLLESAVVELEKVEQRSNGILAGSDWAAAYFALTEPEPQVPVDWQDGRKRHLTSLAECRYAWYLLWRMERELVQGAAPGGALAPAAAVGADLAACGA